MLFACMYVWGIIKVKHTTRSFYIRLYQARPFGPTSYKHPNITIHYYKHFLLSAISLLNCILFVYKMNATQQTEGCNKNYTVITIS